jgi:carbon-monoxide dehydrogenase small subunit
VREVRHDIELTINGTSHRLNIESRTTLNELLRMVLGLTGTKEGCSDSICGTCTVLIDGRSVRSCSILALQARNRSVTTIEGLAQEGKLHPIQEAFVNCGAIQCGYCTPGMILSAKALLDSNPDPTETEIRNAIAGNLCRCTGYVKIVGAIQAAAMKR